jgi:hypothetical protein
MKNKRHIGSFPIDTIPPDLHNFIVFYQKEVKAKLDTMQKGIPIKETDEFFIHRCSFWTKKAHRHAEKLFKGENPDPETIAYKVTLDGLSGSVETTSPFPHIGELVVHEDAKDKFLFKIPCESYDEARDGYEEPTSLTRDFWGSFELKLNRREFKPSRLTAKCIFWYFPEEDLLEVYSMTY